MLSSLRLKISFHISIRTSAMENNCVLKNCTLTSSFRTYSRSGSCTWMSLWLIIQGLSDPCTVFKISTVEKKSMSAKTSAS